MFAILTNNFSRFGHNLFIQKRDAEDGTEQFGPFIYLDNDRSKWKYDVKTHGKVPENPLDHPFATFCKFPKNIAKKLLLLKSTNDNLSLGKLVYWSLGKYNHLPSSSLFTLTEAEYLDAAAKYITDIVDHCLENFPEDEVLFDESWNVNYDLMSNIVNMLATK